MGFISISLTFNHSEVRRILTYINYTIHLCRLH